MNIPKSLIDSTRFGDLVPLIGSGVSQASGIASWDRLIEALKEFLIDSGEVDSIDDFDMFETPDAYLSNSSRKNEFISFLDESIRKGFKPNNLHTLLSKIPFKTYLTTNWDSLIEDELCKTQNANIIFDDKTATSWREALATQIIKFHGTIKNPESIVFGFRSYVELYRKSSTLINLIRTIIATRPILFIGFGMKDLFFKDLLSTIEKNNEHFVILPEKDINRKGYLEKQNLSVIITPSTDLDPYGITTFLNDLWSNTYNVAKNRIERTNLLIRETKRLNQYLGSDKTIRVRASMGPFAVPDTNDLDIFGGEDIYNIEKALLNTVLETLQKSKGKIKIICSPLDGGENSFKKGYTKEAHLERLKACIRWTEFLGDKIEIAITPRASDINDWIVSTFALIESRKSNTVEGRLYQYGQLDVNVNSVLTTVNRFDEDFQNIVNNVGGVELARKEFIRIAKLEIG